MQETISKGSNNHVIITLHGTGGHATSLFEIAHILDPEATKIGFQGEVNEKGMSRYFGRYPDGNFDLVSLANATQNLYDSIYEVIGKYNLKNHRITLSGYSNGANLIKNLLKEFTDLPVANVLLFHPSPITPAKEFQKQGGLNVLMTAGKNDSYITDNQFKEIEKKMLTASIKVATFTHNQGHQLTQEEGEYAKNFLSEKREDIQ
ncbi:alpha/beta hydrolase [Carnobacterium funditum]|uniref:alpha/beta hydrolase n=1 Tax=Carnobacterium funditum TaxID=2752 RepID=UPI0005578FB7|nr:dienelactone hydrolase family protein [Carnobacterium funditum]